jgi:excisionase family DNA binding protein
MATQAKNMNDVDRKLLHRPRSAAAILDMSPSQVYKLIANGTLPSVRLAGSVRVPDDKLKDLIARLGGEAA